MGRRTAPEICIFCGESPCACEPTKKPSKPKSVAKPKPASEPAGEDVFAETVIEKRTRFDLVTAAAASDAEQARDLSAESVLRLLYPLLHPISQKQVDDLLNPPRTQEVERAEIEWRKRNGMGK